MASSGAGTIAFEAFRRRRGMGAIRGHVVGEQPLRREPSRDASRNILLEPRKAVELDDELSRLQCNAA